MSFDMVELERRLSNILRIGAITVADYNRAVVRVKCDGVTTEWLPWLTRRAGGDIDWWAPEIGEQVVVVAPSGLMEAAFVIPALYSDASPEPSNSPDVRTTRYKNGDSITHNRADGSLLIECAGSITLRCGGSSITMTPDSIALNSPRIDLN